jgi:hypothetical protein
MLPLTLGVLLCCTTSQSFICLIVFIFFRLSLHCILYSVPVCSSLLQYTVLCCTSLHSASTAWYDIILHDVAAQRAGGGPGCPRRVLRQTHCGKHRPHHPGLLQTGEWVAGMERGVREDMYWVVFGSNGALYYTSMPVISPACYIDYLLDIVSSTYLLTHSLACLLTP